MLLYEQVVEKLQPEDDVLSGADCSKISMMSGEQSENIFLLVLHYCYTNAENSSNLCAEQLQEQLYKYRPATKSGLGAKFYLSHLPEELQRIIKCYLRLISC